MVGRQIKDRLIALNVERIKQPGMHLDGKGLYLCVSQTGAKSWLFRYSANGGKRREMGLGAYPSVSLAEARQRAEECRKLTTAGKDPLEVRKAEKQAAQIEAARQMSFRQCAEAYIETHRSTWKNAKHAYQWPQSLGTFVYPVFGDCPVQDVDVSLVIQALKPIWRTKTETAIRTRGRIERILDWARVSGFRTGENPARWRGHLDQLLPAPSKIAKVEHHAALPYAEIGAFMKLLRAQGGLAARSLEFTILMAARTGEVIGARWEEIDFTAKVWSIPGERMKAGKPHRVPLSQAALDLLKALQDASEGPYVFPGGRRGKPLSNMAMLVLLRRMGRGDLTAHGFRSTFRDWAAEQTSFPREVAEAALAHMIENKVEAAYRRGELLEKRRRLMEAWASYCERLPVAAAKIVRIKG
jgi:integrase